MDKDMHQSMVAVLDFKDDLGVLRSSGALHENMILLLLSIPGNTDIDAYLVQ